MSEIEIPDFIVIADIATPNLNTYLNKAEDVYTMVSETLELTAPTQGDFNDRLDHIIDVSKLAYKIGIKNNLSNDDLVQLQLACLIHDMYKYTKHESITHGKLASKIAIGLGLDNRFINAIEEHSDKKNIESKDLITQILMEADNLSKISPEKILQYIRDGRSKEDIKAKRKVVTDISKKILDKKLEQYDLLVKVVELENSVNQLF